MSTEIWYGTTPWSRPTMSLYRLGNTRPLYLPFSLLESADRGYNKKRPVDWLGFESDTTNQVCLHTRKTLASALFWLPFVSVCLRYTTLLCPFICLTVSLIWRPLWSHLALLGNTVAIRKPRTERVRCSGRCSRPNRSKGEKPKLQTWKTNTYGDRKRERTGDDGNDAKMSLGEFSRSPVDMPPCSLWCFYRSRFRARGFFSATVKQTTTRDYKSGT